MTYYHPFIIAILLGILASVYGSTKMCRSSVGNSTTDIDNNIKQCSQEFQSELDVFEKEISSLRISKQGSSASHVEKGLRRLDISIRKIFTLQSWYGLEVRSNLPYVKNYIGGKVDQLYELYLGTIIKLLGNSGQLLRIAYAGCKDSKCADSVRQAMNKYQDFMTHLTKLGKYLVNICIRALRYHRYAYYFAKIKKSAAKSLRQYNRTLLLAKKIANECSKVVTQIQEVRGVLMNAFDAATTDYGWDEEKKNKYKEIISNYTRSGAKLNSNAVKLRKQGMELSALATRLKEKTKVNAEEDIAVKKSNLSALCVSVTEANFKEVCNMAERWWGTNATFCEIGESNIITEEDCRSTIEAITVAEGKKRLKRLSKYRQRIQKKQLKYEANKAKFQKMQMKQFLHLKKIVRLMDRIQPSKSKRLAFAVVPLYLAVKSMVIVETQLTGVTQFWGGVLEDKKELVKNPNGTINDGNVAHVFKDIILDSGFSWIAFGKVLRIAALKMRPAEYAVDDAFMRIPTNAEIDRVIKQEAKTIIREVKTLYYRYIKRRKDSIQKMGKIKQDMSR